MTCYLVQTGKDHVFNTVWLLYGDGWSFHGEISKNTSQVLGPQFSFWDCWTMWKWIVDTMSGVDLLFYKQSALRMVQLFLMVQSFSVHIINPKMIDHNINYEITITADIRRESFYSSPSTTSVFTIIVIPQLPDRSCLTTGRESKGDCFIGLPHMIAGLLVHLNSKKRADQETQFLLLWFIEHQTPFLLTLSPLNLVTLSSFRALPAR